MKLSGIGKAIVEEGLKPEDLEKYLDLSREEIECLVLYLLVQDALLEKLSKLPDGVRDHVAHRGERT